MTETKRATLTSRNTKPNVLMQWMSRDGICVCVYEPLLSSPSCVFSLTYAVLVTVSVTNLLLMEFPFAEWFHYMEWTSLLDVSRTPYTAILLEKQFRHISRIYMMSCCSTFTRTHDYTSRMETKQMETIVHKCQHTQTIAKMTINLKPEWLVRDCVVASWGMYQLNWSQQWWTQIFIFQSIEWNFRDECSSYDFHAHTQRSRNRIKEILWLFHYNERMEDLNNEQTFHRWNEKNWRYMMSPLQLTNNR